MFLSVNKSVPNLTCNLTVYTLHKTINKAMYDEHSFTSIKLQPIKLS